MSQTSTPNRRKLQFASEDEVIAEVERLRRTPYRKLGQWSLAQMSCHLANTIEGSLVKPPSDEPTEEQIKRKNDFFAMVMGPAGVPEGMPLPPASVPSPDCGPAEIDRFVTALNALKNYPHRCVTVGRCGPVPVEEIRPLHNLHAAHHLSFLVPIERRAKLRYANADEAIADVKRLRKGNANAGNWTLAQACWHLNTAMNFFMRPGPHPDPGPTPDATRDRLVTILATGQLPTGIQAPEQAIPPATAGETDIDAFLGTLEKYKTFSGPFAPHRIFGKLDDPEAKRLVLIHVAHHLSYLVPL